MAPESPYDVSSDALRTLMGKRKQEMVEALEEQGGMSSLTEKLQTSSDGLDGEEEDLKRRRDVFGPNWVPAAKSKSFLRLLWEAFLDPLLIILAIFAMVALGLNIYTVYGEEDGGRDSEEAKFEWVEPVSNRSCLGLSEPLVMVLILIIDHRWPS